MKIGLLISLPRESKYFFEKIDLKEITKINRVFYKGNLDDKEIILLNTHCGPANAASGAESIIHNFSPDIIINVGSAGSHKEGLLPGDVLVGTTYKTMYNPFENDNTLEHAVVHSLIRFFKGKEENKYDSLDIPENFKTILKQSIHNIELEPIIPEEKWKTSHPYRKPIIEEGVVGSNEAWTTENILIQKKREVFEHDVEDKESAYMAQVCRLHDIPFISFKGVSDNELIFDIKDKEDIKMAIEKSARNAAIVALEFIKKINL